MEKLKSWLVVIAICVGGFFALILAYYIIMYAFMGVGAALNDVFGIDWLVAQP